jgi:hypothetical protein
MRGPDRKVSDILQSIDSRSGDPCGGNAGGSDHAR